MNDLNKQIHARLDAWADADDPGEVFDATERMHNALRAILDTNPTLAQIHAIAAALGVTTARQP